MYSVHVWCCHLAYQLIKVDGNVCNAKYARKPHSQDKNKTYLDENEKYRTTLIWYVSRSLNSALLFPATATEV